MQVDLIFRWKKQKNTLESKVWKQNHLPNLQIYRFHGNQVTAHPMAKNATSCAANSVDQRWILMGPIGWDICKFKTNKTYVCFILVVNSNEKIFAPYNMYRVKKLYCKFQLRYHKARFGTRTQCVHLRPHVKLPRFNVMSIAVGNISVIHNTKALFGQHHGTLTRYLYIGLGRRNRNNTIFRITSTRHTRNN